MDAVIIDTNVLVVANGQSAAPQSTEECVIRCRARLAEVLSGSERILLDDKKRIIQEYKNNLNEKGRGHGDRFWQELVRRMWNPSNQSGKVIRVPITPLAGNGTDFEEFPNDDEALKDFHKRIGNLSPLPLHTSTILDKQPLFYKQRIAVGRNLKPPLRPTVSTSNLSVRTAANAQSDPA